MSWTHCLKNNGLVNNLRMGGVGLSRSLGVFPHTGVTRIITIMNTYFFYSRPYTEKLGMIRKCEYISFSTVDIWGQIIFLMGDNSMRCRVFSISRLYPLNVNSSLFLPQDYENLICLQTLSKNHHTPSWGRVAGKGGREGSVHHFSIESYPYRCQYICREM